MSSEASIDNETTGAKQVKAGLKAKDVIPLAIFSVLFVILCFVGIFTSGMLVVTQPFGIAIAALIAGPVYMYMRARVPAFGGILITGVLVAAAMFFTGAGWIIAAGVLVGALIAELIGLATKYKNFWATALGYSVMMTIYAAGSYAPMVLMRDEYYEQAMSNSVNAEFMLQLLDFYTGPILLAALAVTFVCGILGALLGKKMMKKHLEKAGMV